MSYTIGHEKTFLDSNILIYLLGTDESKKEKATILLDPRFNISTQVIAENVNVCLKKFKLTKEKAFDHGNFLLSKFNVITIEKSFFPIAFQLSTKYQFSLWDSLIVACALQSDCRLLYSEDMHNGFIVEGKLKIVNPFTNL
jgi:predicted nucleic acid-binding protein